MLSVTSPARRIWWLWVESNLQPLVCRTSAPSVELLGQESSATDEHRSKQIKQKEELRHLCCPLILICANLRLSVAGFWWSELESNQPFGLFRPALIRLSYPTGDDSPQMNTDQTHQTKTRRHSCLLICETPCP